MSSFDVEAAARELRLAYETGAAVPVALSARPGFDLDKAYEIESVLKRWREAAGRKSVGRKVGYANKAMWRVLKLETLVWGHMYDNTVHWAKGNTFTLHIAISRSLKIEPEIVFGMKRPIAAGENDAMAALEATEWLAMGFEIIDCPFPDWKFQPGDFVASYGLHAALVIGEPVQVNSEMIAKLADELAQFKVRMLKKGEFVEEGSGRNSLRSPALCLAELARAIERRFPDQLLRAGEIVSSGTLTAGHLTQAGDSWTAEPTGIGLPALRLQLN